MRALLALLVCAGCNHVTTTSASQSGLLVTLVFTPLTSPAGPVTVTNATLSLAGLTAVSDRSADDPRAHTGEVDLTLGAELTLPMPDAPPGLYSGIDTQLTGDAGIGIAVKGIVANQTLTVTTGSAPFDVQCAQPVELEPRGTANLTLRIGMSSWFDGLDLTDATHDADDVGIVISDDDNQGLADELLQNVMASLKLDCAR